MTRIVSFLVLITLLSSCKKLPLYNSKWYDETLDKENYSAASSDYQLSWNVYNNEEHLLVDIRTDHRPSIIKMTRMGFQVLIDETHKKSDNFGITYPVKPKRRTEGAGDSQKQGARGRRPSRGGDADMSKMLEHLPERFLIKATDGEKIENVDALPDGYEAHLKIEEDVLHYVLKLPIKDFSTGADLSELSIGFLSGSSEMNMMGSGRTGGGRPGGGGPPQGAGGSGAMSSQMAEMADPIKIWFKIELANTHE